MVVSQMSVILCEASLCCPQNISLYSLCCDWIVVNALSNLSLPHSNQQFKHYWTLKATRWSFSPE